MSLPEPASSTRSRGGRPRGRFNPAIKWDLARQLGAAGGLSLSEIAARVNTTKQNLHKQKHRWAPAAGGAPELPMESGRPAADDVACAGIDAVAATSLPRSRCDPATILETYIAQFADAVDARVVRFDSVADLERAVRLLAFVRGEAESRTATHATVSLDVMMQRHKAARAYVGGAVDDAVAGVVGRGTGASADEETVDRW